MVKLETVYSPPYVVYWSFYRLTNFYKVTDAAIVIFFNVDRPSKGEKHSRRRYYIFYKTEKYDRWIIRCNYSFDNRSMAYTIMNIYSYTIWLEHQFVVYTISDTRFIQSSKDLSTVGGVRGLLSGSAQIAKMKKERDWFYRLCMPYSNE